MDEHVPDTYATALRSNGFTVVTATDERGQRTVDEDLLTWCHTEGHVLVTNDRDFVELDRSLDHAGLIVYTTQGLTAGEVARGVRRIDRQFTAESVEDELLWLESWL